MKFLIFNFVCFLAVIMLALDSAALSVVSDFLENNTLVVKKGESKLYGIRLQNPGNEETSFKITYDDQIAKIVDYQELYTVPPQANKPVYFNITTKKLKPGDHVMSYTVHELSGSGQGVPILLKISKNLNVRVDENEEKSSNGSYFPVLAILVIIALFVLYFIGKSIKNHFNKKSRRKTEN